MDKFDKVVKHVIELTDEVCNINTALNELSRKVFILQTIARVSIGFILGFAAITLIVKMVF